MPNIYSTPGASAETDVHRCRLWLNYQFDERNQASTARCWPGPWPAVRISDQTGSGTYDISNRLAALLQAGEPNGASPWTLFDLHRNSSVSARTPIARVRELLRSPGSFRDRCTQFPADAQTAPSKRRAVLLIQPNGHPARLRDELPLFNARLLPPNRPRTITIPSPC